MKIRITQLDGSLPNLALMRISAFYKNRGDEVHMSFSPRRNLFEPEYDHVYASCIFKFNLHRVAEMRQYFPEAVIGGSAVEDYDLVKLGQNKQMTVEDALGDPAEEMDYSLYPNFDASIGFTQRGCRLSCGFCVVPKKEGKNRSVKSITEIWRGDPYPKKIHLLDNDFFGQDPVKMTMKVHEMIHGKFRVCFSQGINVRLLNPLACTLLKNIEYRDTTFSKRRLYTAWDNLKDEKIFFNGVAALNDIAGIPPSHLMAYMLVGYEKEETWDRIWYRFNRMVSIGILPYPMVFDRSRADLLSWARWVKTGLYRIVPWDEYKRSTKSEESMDAFSRVKKFTPDRLATPDAIISLS